MHTNIDIVKIIAPLSSTPNSFVNEIENGTNWTPIYYATICQSKEIAKFLSSLTKSPNAADINEWTPIHAASAFGFLDIVELLVPLVTDGVLRAAIETARNWGHNEIVRILETYFNSKP